jgi:hypothetical protein
VATATFPTIWTDKKQLAEQVVAALIAADSKELNSEERALQRKANDKDPKKKQNVIEVYAGRFYKEDKLQELLEKFTGMKK